VPTFKEQGYDVVASISRGVMVRAGTPRLIVDTLVTALDKMKNTEDWKNFSRLNVQSEVNISFSDMQEQVRQEVRDDGEFLAATGIRR
jgi:putative tricarboxylic transport membrane protein